MIHTTQTDIGWVQKKLLASYHLLNIYVYILYMACAISRRILVYLSKLERKDTHYCQLRQTKLSKPPEPRGTF